MIDFSAPARAYLPRSPLAWWRISHPGSVIFMAARASALERESPAGQDTAELIGRLLTLRFYGRRLATVDVLVTALLARAIGGDAAAGLVVNHARRRRGLPPLKWPCDEGRFTQRPLHLDAQSRRRTPPSTGVATGAP